MEDINKQEKNETPKLEAHTSEFELPNGGEHLLELGNEHLLV